MNKPFSIDPRASAYEPQGGVGGIFSANGLPEGCHAPAIRCNGQNFARPELNFATKRVPTI